MAYHLAGRTCDAEAEERDEARTRRRLSLSADRCENQRAKGLARRNPRSAQNSHQGSRSRGDRGMEVERSSGMVAADVGGEAAADVDAGEGL